MASFNISNLTDIISQAFNDNTGLNNLFGRNEKALQELLGSISNGQTILGKVISVDDNSFQISTKNNVIINAKAENGVTVEKGSTVLFEVFKSSDNKVSLRPLYQNTNSQETAKTALREAGLPVNDRSLEMTARNMEYGNPIDRNSLLNSFKDVISFENVPVKYIVDLQQMNINVNQTNLEQYEAYMNMQNSISEGIDNIVDSIIGHITESFSNSNFPENILNSPIDGNGELNNELPLEPAYNNPIGDQVIGESITLLDDLTKVIDKLDSNVGHDLNYSITELYKVSEALNDLGVVTNKLDLSSVESKESYSPQYVAKTIIGDIKNTIMNLKENNDSATTVHSDISKVIDSDIFKEVITRSFSSQWVLNKDKLSDKKEIGELYDRLYYETRDIINVINTSSVKNNVTQTLLQNMNNNLEFMEQLNQYIPYVQIPFRSDRGNNNSELYVYKNKKSFTSGESELSAYLHLDMDYLGPTDVMVKLRDNLVSTKFVMASDESLSLIANNIDFLDKRLQEKGYSLKSEMELNSSSITPIQEMLLNNEEHLIVARNSFDARV